VAKAHVPTASPAPGGTPPLAADKQQELYEEAIRLFYAHKFERAAGLFQKVMQGSNRTLAHHAQVHANICASRLRQPQVQLRTVEDHYNYAVTLLNARRLEEAARHLETALRMAPRADHLHYALAAAHALAGNREGAYQRLKTAIELEPQNRARARADGDFAGMLEYPPMVTLLHLDRRAE
jgi:tetratricopeptide (TPR) repeat protein